MTIELHWSVLAACIGIGFGFGYMLAALMATSGMASRCEECSERNKI
jgi:hypothetical protein